MNDDGAYYLELESRKPGVRGMAVAASHADPADIEAVRIAVEMAAHTGLPFTSEDALRGVPEWQRERLSAFPNAMGGVFYQLARQGIIVAQGYVPATKPAARGRAIRLWRGA